MRNYNLATLAKTDFGYRNVAQALKSETIREVAGAFVGNMDRVLSMAVYPERLIKASLMFISTYHEEIGNFMRNVDLYYRNYDKYIEIRQEILTVCKPLSPEELALLDAGGEEEKRRREDSLFLSDATVMVSGTYLSGAVESILTSSTVSPT